MPNEAPARLQEFITPTLYTLELKPDMTSFSFQGTVSIDIITSKATSEIWIHTKELNVSKASYISENTAGNLSGLINSINVIT